MPLNQTSTLKVSTLVSIGAHPETGRARRSMTDARAIELALNLKGSAVEVVHAGNPHDPALAYYCGMGLSQLRVLEQDAQQDALTTLSSYFRDNMPDIVLTGMRAELGESSGMLPFFLAYQLQCPIVMGIAEILSVENGKAQVLQALPRGQRRAISVSLPFVASVDLAAPEPRQSAFGRARHCGIVAQAVDDVALDIEKAHWEESPAKPKAKRLKVVKAKSAADRFKAATAKAESSSGKVIKDQPIAEMAQTVFDLLLEEGVVH
ncbi:electron transfer flavoprotein subunit beta [Vibrio porteresiae]|uniref:Electron transfer flavoprotein subunit beta n=1 Tax=Vibrio porteresiae DSM 19223 TaxID=1123496 RepID=A0ABZ0QGG2_9VIBR|nr:electron transfer flavoprotein subunit beta [Vibrio porteresiae]WPC75582.1 electron transfer flavoprotein subunit beta [Vibrio porteresiae DSM 19223]